jgi:predicted component of type VI protein secretion system
MIIASREVTFGRDPTLATMVIDLPSLEGLHARLRQGEDGSFILYDQGSVAGTWVNYVPVSSEGARLEHGDMVHIGRAKYRFLYGSPGHIRHVVIKSLSPIP